MPMQSPTEVSVTALLQRWSAGDQEAAATVLPRVYDELRRIARRELRRERPDHTLQATAVVHEAYLRLRDESGLVWPSRGHFFALAGHLIRRVLVDHARARDRAKRGGGLLRVTLPEDAGVVGPAGKAGDGADLLALDDALGRLEALDPRKAAVVELRYFAGLTLDEAADQLGISPETVGREWRRARAWLHAELAPVPPPAEGVAHG